MASETVTPPGQPADKRPRISREHWHNAALNAQNCVVPAGHVMRVLDNVQDVARGISTVMDILNFQGLEDQNEDDPELFVGVGDREALVRLVAAAADLLADQADRTAVWAYEYHTPEGRAERLRLASGAVQEANHD